MKDPVSKLAKSEARRLTRDFSKGIKDASIKKWVYQIAYTCFLAGHNAGINYAIKEIKRR